MQTSDVFRVSREAYQLLSNEDGNNGRALRRFLSRETDKGLVHQGFCFGDGISAIELERTAQTARDVHEGNLCFFPPNAVKQPIGTVVDDCFGLVQNSYELNLTLETASVKEMRLAVQCVAVLSDNLHFFVTASKNLKPA